MSNKTLTVLVGLAVALMVASNCLYVIKETERGVLLKFGEVVNADLRPGLHIKVPMMHQVRKFDSRVLTLDGPPARYLTLEKKGVIVDSFAKWRIIDVGTFYTATSGEEMIAQSRLETRINEGLRNKVADRSMQEVVSGQRDEMMAQLVAEMSEDVRKNYGIELVDIRIKKIDLPEQVSDSVFKRMISEREREAREHRAKGQEQAEVVRADADRQRTIIEANAYRESELARGEGDAKASAIYANAFNKDPEFYRFVRSLNAYKETFVNKGDLLVVDPDSDFFRYFKDAKGAP